MKKSLADMCIDHALGRDREKEMEEDRRREAKPLIPEQGIFHTYTIKNADDVNYYLGVELFSKRPDLDVKLDHAGNSIRICSKNGRFVDVTIKNPLRMARSLSPHNDHFSYFLTNGNGSVEISNNEVSVKI